VSLSQWALFFPAPMSGADRANLRASGVRRVQTFLTTALAHPEQLDYLAAQGVRVSLRLDEPNRGQEGSSYYNRLNHPDILAKVRAVKMRVPVEAVIMGNEPENDYDLTWNSTNWGNMPDQWYRLPGGKAQAHAEAVADLAFALRGMGVASVSPGWTHKRITPRDAPQPGRESWRELTAYAYNACAANGAHLYAHDWASAEDENRYLWATGKEVARCHRAVWINETNVHKKEDVWQMQTVIAMYQLLMAQSWGSRVVSFCPFVSNTGGPGYDSVYVLSDPAAYELLGQMAMVTANIA